VGKRFLLGGFIVAMIACVAGAAFAAPAKKGARGTAPVARIASPRDSSTYVPGTVVSLVGRALDAEDADDRLTYQWDVDALNMGQDRSRILSFKGKTATFVPKQDGAPGTIYEIRLVVSDPSKLRDTALVSLVPGTARATDEVSYQLGPGDMVNVAIYAGGEKQEDFTGDVSPAGTLTSPLIGQIPVTGMTAFQLSGKMREILAREFFVDPQVLVTVRNQARKVFVSGEVRNPGAYNAQEGLTVLSACTLAGGFTNYAAMNRVKVLRNENGTTRTIEIDLSKVRRGKTPDLAIAAGDRVDVPHRRY
jgi:polysaccharide export outer membrane protein